MEKKQYFFGLDLLRVSAIAMVLLAQCIWILPQGNLILSQLAGLFHFIGLEIFLVLSGFLLGNTFYPLFLDDNFGWNSVLNFLKKRAIRILPLYYFILLSNFCIAIVLGYRVNAGWKYFLFLQNFATPMSSFFSESWGLPVIVFATILFPVILFSLKRLFFKTEKAKLFLIATLTLIAVFLASKVIYNSLTTHTTIAQWDAALKSVLVFRLDSVYIGVLVSWFRNNCRSFFKKAAMPSFLFGLVGVAFVFVGVGYFHLFIGNYPFFWNVLYLPITSISIALLLPFLSAIAIGNHSIKHACVYFSSITYAVYLLYLGVTYQLMLHFLPRLHSSMGIVILYLSLLFAVATVVNAVYKKLFRR